MPLKYSSLLKAFIDWTDEEIKAGKKFLDWEEITIKWNELNLHWEDIFILLDRKGGGGVYPYKEDVRKLYEEGNPWRNMSREIGEEKTEDIIKVLCKIKGIEYSKILENKNNIRIVVNDFIRTEDKKEIKIKVKF
jgi:hypothetical protein